MRLERDIVDFENSIGPWLGKTVKIVDYFLKESLNKVDLNLTKEQMIVLKKLHDQDGLNQNELAFLTIRNKSSLTRLLIKMENKKYIIRKQSNDDKRINKVYVTKLGREIFQKTKPVLRDLIDRMEKNISEGEKKQIIKILKKIQFNFNSKIESF
ncbi:MAG: MarR family transcriptional regulator [Bacteroidetes bacterium]|nr:MarR family transcriptional regulator [Bacteroidota bacterium]